MNLFSDEIRERERKRRRKEPLWGLASFLLHGLVIGVIIFCTPVKKLVIPEQNDKPQPAADLTADRLEDLAETLTTARMNELLQQIEAMQAVLHNMDAMKEEIAKDYDTFSAHEAESARDQLEKLVRETETNQARSVEAQKAVKSEVAELVKVETMADLTRRETAVDIKARREKLLGETVEKTNTAQANAVNALDKLEVKASFTGFLKTAEAAEKLREAQMEAAKLQDAAQTETIDVAEKVAQIAEATARVSRSEEELRKAKSDGAKKAHEKRLKDANQWLTKLMKAKSERATEKQVENLEKAEAAQKELNAQLKFLKDTLASDASRLGQLAQKEKRRENALVAEKADAMTVAEAYELAQRLEGEIAVSYKDIKATQTAIVRKMSFEAAQKITDVAIPERMKADTESLRENVRTQAALDRRKKAEAEVVREADSMVEATVAMMEDAMKIVMGEDSSQAQQRKAQKEKPVRRLDEKDLAKRADEKSVEERVAEMDAASDYQVELQNAAAEDANAKAKDLAELMAKTDAEAEAARASTKGAASGPPELKGGDLGLVPGNVMRVSASGKDGLEAKWMYVNSWYVIGPFPNPNRVNLRRKFAPESVQDLDATYVGKDGKILRWRFWQAQSSKPPEPWMADWHAEVIPGKDEYAIYYAYAEVFFDVACDRWVAIGSDDRSDVWLNDIPIWGSSNRLKQWQLAEDFRRVHFRKGRNKLLVRVENGHWNCGWSVCISTTDGKGVFLK